MSRMAIPFQPQTTKPLLSARRNAQLKRRIKERDEKKEEKERIERGMKK